ncbi:hypothetical protein S83_066899 [Arachis hypogaea]
MGFAVHLSRISSLVVVDVALWITISGCQSRKLKRRVEYTRLADSDVSGKWLKWQSLNWSRLNWHSGKEKLLRAQNALEQVKECTKALDLNPAYIKALVRRGEAHEKLEHFEEAIADMKKILEIDPSNDQARKAIRRLEPLAVENREMMKR